MTMFSQIVKIVELFLLHVAKHSFGFIKSFVRQRDKHVINIYDGIPPRVIL